MNRYSAFLILLLFFGLGCQKPEDIVAVLLSEEEITAKNAVIEQVFVKQRQLVPLSKGPQNVIDVNNATPSCEKYGYDAQGRILSEQRCGSSDAFLTYSYTNNNLLCVRSTLLPLLDTMYLNTRSFIISRPKKQYGYFSCEIDYDGNGFLTNENHSFFSNYFETVVTINLKHTYKEGNRIKTVMTPGYYGLDSVVIRYDYDKSAYNPNLPYDDFPLLVDGSSGSRNYFAVYGKKHYSLYGKPSKNLLKAMSCNFFISKRYFNDEDNRTYAYSYTFDDKKRVDSLKITVNSSIYAGICLKKIIYKN
jgi:hypothetical protein